MADLTYYVNTASVGGDGTTNNTTGATAAYASLDAFNTAEVTNLTTDGDTVTVYCDGGNDSTITDFVSWTTTTTNWLLITAHPNSVITGSALDTGKYYRSASGNYDTSLHDTNEQFYVDGLQFSITGNNTVAVTLGNAGNALYQHRLKGCIIRGGGSGKGIGINRATAGPQHVYNNVIYECKRGMRINATSSHALALYNNTIADCATLEGIKLDVDGTNVYIKNNLIVNNTTDYVLDATPNPTTATNITSDATSPDGTTFQSKTITFTDDTNDDYSTGDTDAVGVGTDLSTDSDGILSFSTDILGNTRRHWTVGAFDSLVAVFINDAATYDSGAVLQDYPGAANVADGQIDMQAVPDTTGLTGQLYVLVELPNGSVASRAITIGEANTELSMGGIIVLP